MDILNGLEETLRLEFLLIQAPHENAERLTTATIQPRAHSNPGPCRVPQPSTP